jgi:hypothetical protein
VPRYDYFCPGNGRTVEARHGMSETLHTWGQLCELSGLQPGDTPLDAPVERRLNAPLPITGRGRGETGARSDEPCGPACCCFRE